MTTVLAWLWTRFELNPLWRWITLRRHRNELRALQSARYMAHLAGLPIFLMVGKWLLLLVGLPSFILFVLIQALALVDETAGPVLATCVFLAQMFLAPFVAWVGARWAFGWLSIANELKEGGTVRADQKEAELIAAIQP